MTNKSHSYEYKYIAMSTFFDRKLKVIDNLIKSYKPIPSSSVSVWSALGITRQLSSMSRMPSPSLQEFDIIQILTGTVIKYVAVDCQESYIFPRDYIFPKCAALKENIVLRENITILAPPTRDISTVLVDICYIRWSKWMILSKYFVLCD